MERDVIFKVLTRAREIFLDKSYNLVGMCGCIKMAKAKLGIEAPLEILEFNRWFFEGTRPNRAFWWEIENRYDRITAFDKLIKIYSPGFKPTGCYLSKPNTDVLENLKKKGLSICCCVNFEGVSRLSCHKDTITFDIHGDGYLDKMEFPEDEHNDTIIDCHLDVKSFIKWCKILKGYE